MSENQVAESSSATVKCRLNAIVHDKATLHAINVVVRDFNVAAKAAWLFARYIFSAELDKNPQFDPESYITHIFFCEVLLSCINCRRISTKNTDTLNAREIVQLHQDAFNTAYPFAHPTIAAPAQLCKYQATKMLTAYQNNITKHLPNHIHFAINHLGEVKYHKSRRKKNPDSKQHLKKLTEYKSLIAQGLPECLDLQQLLPIHDVLKAAISRSDSPQGLWYDIAAHPFRHLKTMIEVNRLSLKTFQIFPMSTSWGIQYVTFDFTIMYLTVLRMKQDDEYRATCTNPDEWWSLYFNTNKRPWKEQSGRFFSGTFQTDGLAVSICKTSKKRTSRKGKKNKTDEDKVEAARIVDMEKKRKREEFNEQRKKIKSDGPHKRKTKQEKEERKKEEEVERAKTKEKKSKEFLHITDVDPAELMQDKGKTILIDPGRGDLLYCMHEDSTPAKKRLYRYTADQRRKELKSKEFREACSVKHHPEARAAMKALAATSHRDLSPDRFDEYLAARSAASAVLTPFFANKVHRETRWQIYRLRQQSDARLSNNLREEFGKDPLLVIGDHSSPNMRYQQPIRGVGMLRMLKQYKFRILLLDEYNTSKICPGCDQVNRCFRWRCNPRPWMQNVREVHGLKQCDGCKPGTTKPWNRDLVATLNFRRIVRAQREGKPRPVSMQRVANEADSNTDGREAESCAFRNG